MTATAVQPAGAAGGGGGRRQTRRRRSRRRLAPPAAATAATAADRNVSYVPGSNGRRGRREMSAAQPASPDAGGGGRRRQHSRAASSANGPRAADRPGNAGSRHTACRAKQPAVREISVVGTHEGYSKQTTSSQWPGRSHRWAPSGWMQTAGLLGAPAPAAVEHKTGPQRAARRPGTSAGRAPPGPREPASIKAPSGLSPSIGPSQCTSR